MSKICEKQDDLKTTIKLLCLFKSRKHEEITFIRVAVSISSEFTKRHLLTKNKSTLSAAASIGSLSWPDITTSLWAAKYFLVISLYMSIFALVSTAALRQLDYFPNTTTAQFSEREVHAMLSLLMNFPKEVNSRVQQTTGAKPDTDCEAVASKWCRLRGTPSRYKQYFWQISMMLMSGSWLTYLLGVTLYVLTPVTRIESWSADSVVGYTQSFSLDRSWSNNISLTGLGGHIFSCYDDISKLSHNE